MVVRNSLPFRLGLSVIFGAALLSPRSARAQSVGGAPPADSSAAPLPPLPPSTDPAPPSPPVADPQAPPPGAEVAPQPTVVIAPPPTHYQPTTDGTNGDDAVPKHAPKFALYTGVNLGVIGYGGSFFQNAQNQAETTGNFVGNGLSFEILAGARLGYRYIPYVLWEHAFLARGARFDGTDAQASSDFIGLGFRLLSFDVDNVAFLSDLALGFRSVTITNGNDTFKMTALEIGRLGLGAEIRLSTLVTLSPIARVSIGQMSDSSGSVGYGPNQGDGQTGPSFISNQVNASPRDYVTLGLGCGVQFDFFGK